MCEEGHLFILGNISLILLWFCWYCWCCWYYNLATSLVFKSYLRRTDYSFLYYSTLPYVCRTNFLILLKYLWMFSWICYYASSLWIGLFSLFYCFSFRIQIIPCQCLHIFRSIMICKNGTSKNDCPSWFVKFIDHILTLL